MEYHLIPNTFFTLRKLPLNPGDRVLFKRGEVYPVNFKTAIKLTVPGVTYSAYGEGTCPVLRLEQTYASAIVHEQKDPQADNCTIQDLIIENATGGAGIKLHYVRNVLIENVVIRDCQRGSGKWCAGAQVRHGSAAFQTCTIYNIEGEGIYVGNSGDPLDASTVVVKECVIRDCASEGIDLKNGAHHCLISDVLFRDNGQTGDNSHIFVGGQDNVIENCGFGGAVSVGIRLGAYWDDEQSGLRNTLQDCIIDGATTAIYLGGDGNQVLECRLYNAETGIRCVDYNIGHIIRNVTFMNIRYPYRGNGLILI